MQALIFNGIGDIKLSEVPNPKIQQPNDTIVKITTSAICGTDLHFIRGTVGEMKKGTILGHEAVGIVEKIGKDIKNLNEGDRVIVPSTVACGYCRMCRLGNFSQCDVANPNGPEAGTAFFGGPKSTGPLQGCQAEFVRVPFGNHNLVKIPNEISDDKAILLSDIFPTAYYAVDLANVKVGDVVAVLGCGPVGQFVIASCRLRGASRIFAIDAIPSRLDLAKTQGAECINFNEEDPIKFIKEATKGMLVDVVVDAVGVDAFSPKNENNNEFKKEISEIAPKTNPKGKNWIPGNAPSYALRTAVDLVGKCGIISIVGVYSQNSNVYPIGKAMNKNLKIVMGNCPHRKYIPLLLHKVQAGLIDPSIFLTQTTPLNNVLDAYKQFDIRQSGWIKVALKP